MQTLIETWQQQLTQQSALHPTTIIQYTHDVGRFAAWMDDQARPSRLDDVTVQDAKDYRNYLIGQGRSPATINRALISLTRFLDAVGRAAANPFRKVNRVEVVAHPPHALTYEEWRDVRQAAERMAGADHHLAHALVCLMRYAGPRVGEVAALELPDVQISSRRGRVIIRRGKGLKHREVPLIAEVREPLQAYLLHRKHLGERWGQKAQARGNAVPSWARWPDGHLFLGQRGPLTERGMREIVTKVGHAAKLDAPLSPHALRHTFAKALLDPAAYHLDRQPATITAVQELLGHSHVDTTAIYTRASAADIARMLGEESAGV